MTPIEPFLWTALTLIAICMIGHFIQTIRGMR